MPYVKPKPFYTLLDKVDFCLENGQPFVLYRKPTDPLIKGVFQSDNQLHKEVITTLHPTPAVCGIPTPAAKAFIQQQEKYQRTFYTGFWEN